MKNNLILLLLLLSISVSSQSIDLGSEIKTSDVFVMNGKEYPVFTNNSKSKDLYIKVIEKETDNSIILWLCNCEYEVMSAQRYKNLTGVTVPLPAVVFFVGNVQTYPCPAVTGLERIKELFPHLSENEQKKIFNISKQTK